MAAAYRGRVESVDPRRRASDAVFDDLAADGPGPVVVRDGSALLVRQGDVLLRVRHHDGGAVAAREVEVARALIAAEVPATALVDVEQPITVEGCVVTAWRWAEGGVPPTVDDLGRLAGVLRERTRVHHGGLAAFDPLDAVVGAVAHLPLGDPDVAFVHHRVGELATAWQAFAPADPAGTAVVHGDLHAGNVVPSPQGPLLTDFELSGVGPPSYDAAPAAAAVRRYGAPTDDLDRFLAAAGLDPMGWDGWPVCVDVYELWVTAWAVGVRDRDAAWADEAATRVATLRDGAGPTWRLH